MAKAPPVEVEVGGRRLSLTNLDKQLYPTGFTKADVIRYHTAIAPAILPHLRRRALTMKRYPDGSEGPFFYEKRCPKHAPDWVARTDLWVTSDGTRWGTAAKSGVAPKRSAPELVPFVVVEEVATLVWLANLAALELHTPMGRAVGWTDDSMPAPPSMVVFDLDPGAPATAVECAVVALHLREVLDHLGLVSVVKSSGSKGLQVYVPLNTPTDFAATRGFAQAMAQLLEKQHPDLVVSQQRKDIRPGKVLVDWFQNEPSKTTISVYSLRARPKPWVSAPLTWDEVEVLGGSTDPDAVLFEADEVLARVEEHGDLFAPVLTVEQTLPTLG